ncbi:zinc-dependent metalloprotease [Streptomyces sp. NBC_00654]|uniref:M12 family metallo-peptidase n=1 Tax=Streptomyces sp. NBC_00654 TaxID=2975799 RepID=UPI00225B0D70|nr:M12 family metallo-peptidase [Streptomyces sp. NBC_00654]MCX4967757.1 zinc-dependent metalloprotease [Streptomyces sp. NBC_00654]
MKSTLLKTTLVVSLGASLYAAPSFDAAPQAAPTRHAAARCPVVDVLAVYTPKAAARVGGVHRVAASAQQIAIRMNRSLRESGVCGAIRIVHPYTATGYDGPEQFHAAYRALKDRTNSALGREADERRGRYGADLVTLMVDPPERGGGTADYAAALDSTSDEYAYSVADVDGIALDSVSHEIGHNLGLAHDRVTIEENAHGSMDVSHTRPYNTGWVTEDRKYYTIMAYRSSCGDGCERISRFSSAQGAWRGRRLGDTENDSVRVLRATLPIVAGYRGGR